MDAWARVRPRERDGDRGHAEEQAVAGKGTGNREGAREERRGGVRGERVGRVGFAGSPLLIFPVRLTASSFRSWSSFFFPLSLLPPVTLVPRIRLPRLLRPFRSRSLVLSLPSCSLMPCRPSILDLCLSLFSSLFSYIHSTFCIRRSSFLHRSFSLLLRVPPLFSFTLPLALYRNF